MRDVWDPHLHRDRGAPKSIPDLVAMGAAADVLLIDNLSYCSPDMSDALCRMATGGSVGERRLYVNQEEAVTSIQIPIVLNGVPDFATRSDLLDRSLHIELQRLSSYRQESQLAAEWAKAHPLILGALLDLASVAIRERGQSAPGEFRMADFVSLAEAAGTSPQLRWKPGAFAALYRGDLEDGQWTVLEADQLAGVFMRIARGGFDGTAADLLAVVDGTLVTSTPDGQKRSRPAPKGWPRTAVALSNRLKALEEALIVVGVRVQRRRAHRGVRTIVLSYEGTDDGLPAV